MSAADKEKLIIRFFNVGDGDSALLERLGEKPFRLLVDAGSSLPEALHGGCVCAEYLRALGVSLKPSDRTELETLIPPGAQVIVSEL